MEGGDDMAKNEKEANTKPKKKLCPACNGSGGLYREVQELATGRRTKVRETCRQCKGAGEVDAR